MINVQQSRFHQSSLFFVPNIVDYGRIVLLIAAIGVFNIHPWLGIFFYAVNSFLDMLDGSLARLLNQQSKLGTLLDFSIDRAAITLLFSAGILLIPSLASLFAGVMALDIASHFAICTAGAYHGSSQLQFTSQGSRLLVWFAQKSWVRYVICTSHDAFFGIFICNYLLPSKAWFILWIVCLPGTLVKTWIHLERFYVAAKFVAALDNQP